MSYTFKWFREQCRAAGSEPAPEFAGLRSPYSTLADTVEFAGKLLRKNPGITLANKPVTGDWPEHTAVRALVDIVNSSILPVTDSSILTFDTPDPQNIDKCPMTEPYFARMLHGFVQRESTPACEIYVTDDMRPVFVRKSEGLSSSLSLEPVAINGVLFPQLSVMRVDRDSKQQGYNVLPDDQISLYPVRAINGVTFARISGMGYTPEERKDSSNVLFWSGHVTADESAFYATLIREEVQGMVAGVVADILSRHRDAPQLPLHMPLEELRAAGKASTLDD